MQPNEIQSIIENAGAENAYLFSGDERLAAAVSVRQAKDEEDARSIASAWAHFYQTPEGRMALERLFDTTLRRTVFFVNLGLDPHSMANFGAFREGQNALAQEIARQIGLGMAEPVKPRDI